MFIFFSKYFAYHGIVLIGIGLFNSLLSNLYFKISNVSSQTVAIQARVSNLRANNQATSQNVTVNLFCDLNSFTTSGNFINSTKCTNYSTIYC